MVGAWSLYLVWLASSPALAQATLQTLQSCLQNCPHLPRLSWHVQQVLDGATVLLEAPPLTVTIPSAKTLSLSLCRLPRRGQLHTLVLRAPMISLAPHARKADPAAWRARHDSGNLQERCLQVVRLHAQRICCDTDDTLRLLRDLTAVTALEIVGTPGGKLPPVVNGLHNAAEQRVKVQKMMYSMLVRNDC